MPALAQPREQLGEQLHLPAGAAEQRGFERVIGRRGRTGYNQLGASRFSIRLRLKRNLLREPALARRAESILLRG